MTIEIRLISCMRKNGGFATKETPMVYAELWNTAMSMSIPIAEADAHGRAREKAKIYSELLGVPIKEYVERKRTVTTSEEIVRDNPKLKAD